MIKNKWNIGCAKHGVNRSVDFSQVPVQMLMDEAVGQLDMWYIWIWQTSSWFYNFMCIYKNKKKLNKNPPNGMR